MIELKGKYNIAKVFTDNVEETAISQIIELCNQEVFKKSKVRVMPDTHAGASCVIGTTMTIIDKVVPNLVGVDIGCGMYVIPLKEKEIDFEKLDKAIRKYVPCGQNVRDSKHAQAKKIDLELLKCKEFINKDRAVKSLGTLGGGNHFIELNKDDEGNLYLVIHSGSRYLGKQVAEHYQKIAYEKLMKARNAKVDIINKLKAEGKEKEIETELSKIQATKINKDFAYVEGIDLDNYLYDMNLVQAYATLNREIMGFEILKHMDLHAGDSFTTIHNYIDLKNLILRKGAISAQKNEKVIIPINMRDGSIIAIGKGNPDWNYSAPHGAGRIYSRSKAKEKISLDEFEESMKGIWSSSISVATIDESPMVYKPIDEIMTNIKDTVDIVKIIKPLYNFKAN